MFIIQHKKIFILVSLGLALVALGLAIFFGLQLGIDFKGGAITEAAYPEGRPEASVLERELKSLGLGNVLIQPAGEKGFFVKTRDLSEEERLALSSGLSFGEFKAEVLSFNSIGPSVGRELAKKSVLSLILVSISIILFIAFAFRKVSRPVSSWKYGIITIFTLIYDALIPVGIFAVLSHYFGAEVDTLFVVAMLTILGISINDKIVVFDRVRENLRETAANINKSEEFNKIVGASITQTLTRSINTSVTVILVLLSLFFVGPASTKYFSLLLISGMIVGTYSSISLASPLLVLWEERQSKTK